MSREDFRFEICANGVESCLAAQAAGADRVELCASIPEGGTTPSYGEIKVARRMMDLRAAQGQPPTALHVIIRPRGGDFVYAPAEVERMLLDIEMARNIGADGVVFGCLTSEGDVDIPLCQQLMEAAEGLSVTFHRAFDRCRNPQNALEDIIELGCHRLLTSGQQPTAEQGIPLLKELNQLADNRIVILAGCGVNEGNIRRIHQETGIREFHFSAREQLASDPDFGTRYITTERRVRTTIEQLN